MFDVQSVVKEALEADVSEHQSIRGRRLGASSSGQGDEDVGDRTVDALLAQHFRKLKCAIACVKKMKKADVLSLASKWCKDDPSLDSLLRSNVPTIRAVMLDLIEGMDMAEVEIDLQI